MFKINYYKAAPSVIGKNSFVTMQEADNYLRLNGFRLNLNKNAYEKIEGGKCREAVIQEA